MQKSYIPLVCSILLALYALASLPAPQGKLMQVHQDFHTDPGWEAVNNRVIASDPPTVTQDFGWTATDHAGSGPGEIGGTLWQSRTPAWYGMPLAKPLSFRDRFSFSGRIAVLPGDGGAAAYLGFFNSTRQEWRPWNSMAIRVILEKQNRATFGLDYMTALWNGGGYETDIVIPADGKPHTFRFTYDPDARLPAKRPDERLHAYLSRKRQTAEQILERAKQAEPDVTLEQITQRLRQALAQGLVAHFRRSRGNFYALNADYANLQGAILFQVDNGLPYKSWMPKALRDAPVSMDRFGLFNLQVYHRAIRFFVSDLTLNDRKMDMSKDTGWEAKGNRRTFVEQDFQRQDFGYSRTNWAGKASGEIGGLFYRTEPIDPIHGYYADDVGYLTLEDPLSFSGHVCFLGGGTDAGMFFGFFNRTDEMKVITDAQAGAPLDNTLGIVVDGPTRVGYYFTAMCSPRRELATQQEGPVFLPTGQRHTFRFDYDPKANDDIGRITVTLDSKTFTLDLTPEQRKAGATFNRFGLADIRRGGKYVILYFDDLEYTARHPDGYKPVHHPQEVTVVPYHRGGRKY